MIKKFTVILEDSIQDNLEWEVAAKIAEDYARGIDSKAYLSFTTLRIMQRWWTMKDGEHRTLALVRPTKRIRLKAQGFRLQPPVEL